MGSIFNARVAMTAAICTVGAIGLAGCGGGGADQELTAESIIGEWELVSGSGPTGDVKALEQPITANFQTADQISTSVGCNNIFGPVEIAAGGAVHMGPLAMTMMMCDEPLMELETAYAGALEAVTKGKIENEKLILEGADTRLEYARAS